MARRKGFIRKHRRFGGKRYTSTEFHESKKRAMRVAKKMRNHPVRPVSARVVERKIGVDPGDRYIIYTRERPIKRCR